MNPTVPAESPRLGRRELIAGAGAVLAALAVSPPGRSVIAQLSPFGSGVQPFELEVVQANLGTALRVVEGAAAGAAIAIESASPFPGTAFPDLQFGVTLTQRRGERLDTGTYLFDSSVFGEILLYVEALDDPSGVYRLAVDRYIPGPSGQHREGQP